jgi:uncharacterized protein (DUF433 family)
MENKGMRESYVWTDPERMGGTPCFRGTRVPVKSLFDYLQGGHGLSEFLEDFPSVEREQAVEAIETAGRRLVEAHDPAHTP